MLFEAPHGTAHDLYEAHIASGGATAHFNSSALIYAVANALFEIAQREANQTLEVYALELKQALIDTVDQGIVTPDLCGKTSCANEQVVDMLGFLEAVQERLS